MDSATYLIGEVDAATVTYIYDTFIAIGAALDPILRKSIVLFAILYGYFWWQGKLQHPAEEVVAGAIKIGVIYALITEWPFVSVVLVNFLTDGPSELGGVILTASGAGTNATINSFMGNFIETGISKAGEALQSYNLIMGVVVALILTVGTLLIGGYLLFLIVLSKIALAVLLGLAPVFFLLLLFKGTSKMFESWLQQSINYAILPVFAYGAGVIMLSISNRALNRPDIAQQFGFAIIFLITSVIGLLVLTQVYSMAAAIAGGIQLSSEHRQRREMKRATRDIAGAANKARRWAGARIRDHRGKGTIKQT